jgi:hypothetical protein
LESSSQALKQITAAPIRANKVSECILILRLFVDLVMQKSKNACPWSIPNSDDFPPCQAQGSQPHGFIFLLSINILILLPKIQKIA